MQQRRRLGLGELGGEVVAEAPGEHEVDDEHASRHGVDGERALGQRRQDDRAPPSTVTTSTRHDAGSSRRARRAQNPGSDSVPVDASSLSSRRVIRKPDRTKNTSTPTKPPWKAPRRRWNSTTATTASGPQALDVGAELVVGDAVQLLADGASAGDVGRHPIVQVDAPERRVLHRRRPAGAAGGRPVGALISTGRLAIPRRYCGRRPPLSTLTPRTLGSLGRFGWKSVGQVLYQERCCISRRPVASIVAVGVPMSRRPARQRPGCADADR